MSFDQLTNYKRLTYTPIPQLVRDLFTSTSDVACFKICWGPKINYNDFLQNENKKARIEF